MGMSFGRGDAGVTRPDYSQVLTGPFNDKRLPLEEQLPPCPLGSSSGAGLGDSDNLYYLGGQITGNGTIAANTIDDVVEFSFSDWQWTESNFTLPRVLYGASFVSIGDTHILTGGFSSDYRDETFEVDLQNGVFNQVATQPASEWQPWFTSDYQDKLWVGGGFGLGDTRDTDIHEYSISNQTWTKLGDMPNQIYSASATYNSTTGLIYVFGGFDNLDNTITTISTYDPSSNTWTADAINMGVSRVNPFVGMINGSPTIIGSGSGTSTNKTDWIVDLGTNSFAQSKQSNGSPEAGAHVVVNGVYYFFGGERRDQIGKAASNSYAYLQEFS